MLTAATRSNMASSYWESTQRKFWTFTKQELDFQRRRIEDSERSLVSMNPLPDRRHLSIYFYHRTSRNRDPSRKADQFRTLENGKTFRRPATGSGDSSGVRPAILREDRNPQDQPSTSACYCSLPGLQDGGMSTTHTNGARRGSALLG